MPHTFTVADRISAADLARAGLLDTGQECVIDAGAAFVPADALGVVRPVRLGARCVIAAGAVVHGGVILHDEARVEEFVVIGKPEHGYAVRAVYPGAGGPTEIGAGVVLRSGAIVYAGVRIGGHTSIGHHTLLRTDVTVGADSQLGHHLTVERGTRIGVGVRCSPGSHLTANTLVEDRVFLGSGVRTINDKELIWRDPDHETELCPPTFRAGCKVGSGVTILAGVTVGSGALVGGRVGGHPRRSSGRGRLRRARPRPHSRGAGSRIGGGVVSAVDTWLNPIRTALPDIDAACWGRLADLDARLDRLTANTPTPDAGQATRSEWLLHVRRALAEAGYARPGWPAVAQTLAQFVCGFHDLDLRDATGTGHGALLHHAASDATRTRWLDRIAAGHLIGVAATERHGGSRVHEITTRAVMAGPHRWVVTGEKVWVSRLLEASGMVVFFRDPDAHISAAIIDTTTPGVCQRPIPPAGLTGWTWGELHLRNVPIDPRTDLIGEPGHGLDLFRRHFARFRPLVAATALGTAAGVHTLVAATLDAKQRAGVLPRIRDNALITLGRTHAAICSALLATVHTARLCAVPVDDGDLWARLGKAHAVDTAHHAVHDLAPLVGADGYRFASTIAKARADLTGLLYADGIHDSLYRSGGRTLLAHAGGRPLGTVHPLPAAASEPADRPAAA